MITIRRNNHDPDMFEFYGQFRNITRLICIVHTDDLDLLVNNPKELRARAEPEVDAWISIDFGDEQ